MEFEEWFFTIHEMKDPERWKKDGTIEWEDLKAAYLAGREHQRELDAGICFAECAKGGECDEEYCDCCYLGRKIREQE